MLYEYSPLSLQKNYENEKWLKKKYGSNIAEGMIKFLNVLEAAENAYDIKSKPQFYMEHKKRKLKKFLCYFIRQEKK